MRTQDVTPEQIQAFKDNLKNMGICSYTVSGMNEEDSIRQAIAESWSFTFAGIQDPYHQIKNRQAKSLRFRIFQINKDNPKIPMGYSGMPGLSFECFDGQPAKKLIELLKAKLKFEYTYKVSEDYVTCYRVLNEFESREKAYKKEFLLDAKVGDLVTAHWSYSNRQFKAKSKVVKVNDATYKVQMLEDVRVEGDDFSKKWFDRDAGFILTIPRTKQTQFNCLTV